MKTIWLSTKTAAIAMMCLSLSSISAYGQGNVGTIIGHVGDQSGGAILGATVTLLNPATNEKRTIETNEQGDYVFNGVRPARYTISAEFKGFKVANKENI